MLMAMLCDVERQCVWRGEVVGCCVACGFTL